MPDSLHTLTINQDPTTTERLISSIKSLGYIVRNQNIEDLASLIDTLKSGSYDFIFNDMAFEDLPLAEIVEVVKQSNAHPAIISLDPENHHSVTEAMQAGAHDLIQDNDYEHLKLVVQRALQSRSEHQKLTQLKASFNDLENLYATLMETYEAPVAYLHEGIHVHANQAYCQLFGLAPHENLEGIPLMDLLPESEQQLVKQFLQRHKRGENNGDDSMLLQIDDTEHVLEITDVYYDSEPCQQIVIKPSPSGEETSQLTEQFNYLAIYDIASGLYTRNHLIEQLESCIATRSSDATKPAVIMLSLDNYNELASGIGLAEADMLYSEVGAELKNQLSLDDVLCRYDAQTFCLLTTPIEFPDAVALIRTLLDSVASQLFDINGKHIPCQLSAGLTIVDENAISAYQLISEALESLRQANLKGIDFDNTLPQQQQKPQRIIDQEWTERMRIALKESQFRLFFQPIVSLNSESSDQYSVSVKIARPEGGYSNAAEFMPSAERTGYAKGIDHWIIDEALRILAEEAEQDHYPTLFIKLTQGTLYYEEDISWIRRQIESRNIDTAQLVFEINTSSLINHLQQTRILIDDLRPKGCRFAVDDFGNSLNPFQILRHVDIDFLKLDGSLTRDIETNDQNQQLLSYIAHHAHEEEQTVIAQKVEEPNQFFLLKELGLDYAQGDFLSKPRETLEFNFEFPQ
ncbi:MAG TPA: EAL domain-containing protein [Gammaproteobacteria bacterium]|nr:EAL domain-containing protein [Gammaproteobacteria bacterium]